MDKKNTKKTTNISEYKRVYNKEYRTKNKNIITEDIKCDACDSYYTKENKTHHFKTKKHITNELLKMKMEQVQDLQNKINQVQNIKNMMDNIINCEAVK